MLTRPYSESCRGVWVTGKFWPGVARFYADLASNMMIYKALGMALGLHLRGCGGREPRSPLGDCGLGRFARPPFSLPPIGPRRFCTGVKLPKTTQTRRIGQKCV